jgi:hypothetical protein
MPTTPKGNVPGQRPHLYQGLRLPYFQPGDGRPSVWSAGDMNKIVAVCNAILNAHISRGDSDSILISDHNLAFQLEQAAEAASGATSAGMHPFRVYNPTGEMASTFRIRGGYAIVPELFPASTTQRDFSTADSHSFVQVEETDGVYEVSDEEGDATYDLDLSNWDNGLGGLWSFWGIWLQIFQDLGDPGNIVVSIENQGGYIPAACTIHANSGGVIGGDTETNYIPLAMIFPTSFDGNTLLAGTIHQLQHSSINQWRLDGATRYVGPYHSERVYWPGDIIFYSGFYMLNTNRVCIINYTPAGGSLGDNWAFLT